MLPVIQSHCSAQNAVTCSVIAGSKIYAFSWYEIQPAGTVCTPSDSQGNTYTLMFASSTWNPSYPSLTTYKATATATGSLTVSENHSPCQIIIVTGRWGAEDNSQGCLSGGSSCTQSSTTSGANDIIFAGMAANTSSGFTAPDPSESGWIYLDGLGHGPSTVLANVWYKNPAGNRHLQRVFQLHALHNHMEQRRRFPESLTKKENDEESKNFRLAAPRPGTRHCIYCFQNRSTKPLKERKC